MPPVEPEPGEPGPELVALNFEPNPDEPGREMLVLEVEEPGPEELCVFDVKELPLKALNGLPEAPAVLWVLDVKVLPPTEPGGEPGDPEVICVLEEKVLPEVGEQHPEAAPCPPGDEPDGRDEEPSFVPLEKEVLWKLPFVEWLLLPEEYPENAEWERLEPPGTLFPLGPVEEVKDDPWKPPPAFVAPGPNPAEKECVLVEYFTLVDDPLFLTAPPPPPEEAKAAP